MFLRKVTLNIACEQTHRPTKNMSMSLSAFLQILQSQCGSVLELVITFETI